MTVSQAEQTKSLRKQGSGPKLKMTRKLWDPNVSWPWEHICSQDPYVLQIMYCFVVQRCEVIDYFQGEASFSEAEPL